MDKKTTSVDIGVESMSIKNFKIVQEETEKEYILNLSGELDLSVAMQLRNALEPIVHKTNKTLILNLGNLKYIDSTGIGIIISVLKIRDEKNAGFFVRNIPAVIRRVLDLTGVSGFLKEELEDGA